MFYLSIFLALFQDSKSVSVHQGNAGLRNVSPPMHLNLIQGFSGRKWSCF